MQLPDLFVGRIREISWPPPGLPSPPLCCQRQKARGTHEARWGRAGKEVGRGRPQINRQPTWPSCRWRSMHLPADSCTSGRGGVTCELSTSAASSGLFWKSSWPQEGRCSRNISSSVTVTIKPFLVLTNYIIFMSTLHTLAGPCPRCCSSKRKNESLGLPVPIQGSLGSHCDVLCRPEIQIACLFFIYVFIVCISLY